MEMIEKLSAMMNAEKDKSNDKILTDTVMKGGVCD